MSTQTPSLFICPECPTAPAFRRLEHYQRHRLSHTNYRPFACNFCKTTFNRRFVLTGHDLLMKTREANVCPPPIRDALTRHFKICQARLKTGESIPSLPSKKKGKKKQSCDRCSHLKRACSRTFPCTSCQDRKLECSYREAEKAIAHASSTPVVPITVPPVTSAALVSTQEQQFDIDLGYAAFADSVTPVESYGDLFSLEPFDSGVGYFSSSSLCSQLFQYPDLSARIDVPAPLVMRTHSQRAMLSQLGGLGGLKTGFLANFVGDRTQGIAKTFWPDDASSLSALSILPVVRSKAAEVAGEQIFSLMQRRQDALEARIPSLNAACARNSYPPSLESLVSQTRGPQIVAAIRAIWKEKYHRLTWSSSIEALCNRFFSLESMQACLDLYWTRWHPHTPFIHHPTFDPAHVSIRLLASMVLMGAAMSDDYDHRVAAAMWFDAVEDWVMASEDFIGQATGRCESASPSAAVQGKLEALLAAYLMVLIQTWEGSEDAKDRVVQHRYHRVVSSARCLRKFCSHGDLVQNYLTAGGNLRDQWLAFALVESLIRTITYVYLLDCAHGIFFNLSTRMLLTEASFALTCPEALYDADTVEEWEIKMGIWANSELGRRNLTLRDAIVLSTKEHMTSSEQEAFRQMSTFNLFSLSHALHSSIRSMVNATLFARRGKEIENALLNWSRAWSHRISIPGLEETSRSTIQPWMTAGFKKYAYEYYFLAWATLIDYDRAEQARLSVASSEAPYVRDIQDLIERFEDLGKDIPPLKTEN